MLICEMAAYYRANGSSIKQRLEEIYSQYGRYFNKTDSFEFPGLSGMDKMAGIMTQLRQEPPAAIGAHKITKAVDFKNPKKPACHQLMCFSMSWKTALQLLFAHLAPNQNQGILHHPGQGFGRGSGSERRAGCCRRANLRLIPDINPI